MTKHEAIFDFYETLSEEKRALVEAELRTLVSRRKIYSMYPETGPLRRELYPRHMEFFAAGGWHEPLPTCPEECDGSPHRSRLILAANRVGKTEGIGGYELTMHLTGQYPEWWPGHRFDKPVRAWASGKTNETTRDIIQAKMFGRVVGMGLSKNVAGTGLVPGDLVGPMSWKRGVRDLIDTVSIKHVSGGTSTLGLKAYEQGRGAFEGTEQDVILFDEEPPLDVYVEASVRLMTTQGLMMLTFTPLEGVSDVVKEFLPSGQAPQRRQV